MKQFAIPGLMCLLGVVALCVDVPLARLAHTDAVPTAVREVFENLEAFGHGAGVALIALVVWNLDVNQRRRKTAGVLLAAFGAGLAANLLKLAVRRDRPWHVPEDVVGGLDTFHGLFPGLAGSAAQSFPSAHAATAMGLAVALARYYPRGRFVFFALAVATSISRVIATSHYLSDALIGLALGAAVGQFVLSTSRFSAGAQWSHEARPAPSYSPLGGADAVECCSAAVTPFRSSTSIVNPARAERV